MGECLIRRRRIESTPPVPTVPTWANGTDAEIVALIQAADAGQIDLSQAQGWEIGSERRITIGALPYIMSDDPWTTEQQEITLIIMDSNTYNLVEPIGNKTKCNFIVGLKNPIQGDPISIQSNVENYNISNFVWIDRSARTWCNTSFKNAIPSSIRSIFKQVRVPYNSAKSEQNLFANDYFSFFAGTELSQNIYDGTNISSGSDLLHFEKNNIHTFSYFLDENNASDFLYNSRFCTRSFYETGTWVDLIHNDEFRLESWWGAQKHKIVLWGAI